MKLPKWGKYKCNHVHCSILWNEVILIDFGGFLKVLKICYFTQAPATECKTIWQLALSFIPFPKVIINFFEDIPNQRPIKVTLPNGVTLIALGVTLITLGVTLIGQSKVTRSVNKVNIIIINKNKLSFLWHLFWDEKHVGECMNKKTKYFYVYIFNISNFDHNFGVTLIAATG